MNQNRARTDLAPELSRGEDEELDLLEVLGTFWRGKWIILFCSVLALLAGYYYTTKDAVPMYSASTRLAINFPRPQVVDFQTPFPNMGLNFLSLNTEMEVVRSRRLAEQVVERLDLTKDPIFNPYLREREIPFYEPFLQNFLDWLSTRTWVADWPSLQQWLDWEPEPLPPPPSQSVQFNTTVSAVIGAISATLQENTYLFTISATTTDPDKSVLLANTLADLYIEDQIAVKFEATENAVAWLSDRVSELEAELMGREDAFKDLLADSNVVTPNTLAVLNKQASDMQSRLEELRTNAESAVVRLEQLRELQTAGDAQDMRAAFPDPVLQRLFNDLPSGNEQTRELFDERFSLLVEREAADAERAITQAVSLKSSYDALQAQISDQTQDLAELQQLEREVEATRVLYETFLTRLKEISLQRGLQEADARIISPAASGAYLAPPTKRILTFFFIVGALIGAALILLRQYLHRGFRTGEDLEKHTGISVIGQIPKMPISNPKQLVGYLDKKSTSAVAEAIRNLRTSVLLSNIDSPPKVIMSTSSVPGEGKTTQAISLAQNFARIGKTVLLMECDIRRRTFSKYIKGAPDAGVVSALSGERSLKDLIFHDDGLNADVLMGEKSPVNAADLFSSERFHEFMQNARKIYDIVIIDTPPVLVVPDARVVGQHADAILYSVAWDRTTKAQLNEGLRQLDTAKLKITGFVLSQIDPAGMRRYGYGGRYGAYSSYGKKYYDT